jgi:hypothetical protein
MPACSYLGCLKQQRISEQLAEAHICEVRDLQMLNLIDDRLDFLLPNQSLLDIECRHLVYKSQKGNVNYL